MQDEAPQQAIKGAIWAFMRFLCEKGMLWTKTHILGRVYVPAYLWNGWARGTGMQGYNKAHVLGEMGDDLQHPLFDNADSK